MEFRTTLPMYGLMLTEQYTVDISDVLDHEETEPFEASDALESNLDADAWTELYNQYIGE